MNKKNLISNNNQGNKPPYSESLNKGTGKNKELLNDKFKNIMSDIIDLMLECVTPDTIKNWVRVCEILYVIDNLVDQLLPPLALMTDVMLEKYIIPFLVDEDDEFIAERSVALAGIITDYWHGIITMLNHVKILPRDDDE